MTSYKKSFMPLKGLISTVDLIQMMLKYEKIDREQLLFLYEYYPVRQGPGLPSLTASQAIIEVHKKYAFEPVCDFSLDEGETRYVMVSNDGIKFTDGPTFRLCASAIFKGNPSFKTLTAPLLDFDHPANFYFFETVHEKEHHSILKTIKERELFEKEEEKPEETYMAIRWGATRRPGEDARTFSS